MSIISMSLHILKKLYQKFCVVGQVESNSDIAVAKSVDAEVVADDRKVILYKRELTIIFYQNIGFLTPVPCLTKL